MIQAYRLDAGFSSRCASCGYTSQEAWAIKIRDGYEIELCSDCIKKLMRNISKELNNNPLERAVSSVEETLEVELALDMQKVVADFIKESFLVEVTLPDGTLVRASRDDDDEKDSGETSENQERRFECCKCHEIQFKDQLVDNRCSKCGGGVYIYDHDDLEKQEEEKTTRIWSLKYSEG